MAEAATMIDMDELRGLAVALGETALGLFVAIPAAIFYQYFSKKSDEFYNKLENQVKELKRK